MSATMTFIPQHSSPLARTTSSFKDPQPQPCTPGQTAQTAQIWDEYERRAVENARRRDTTYTSSSPRQTQQSPRFSSGSVLDIIKSYDPHSSPGVPSLKGSPQFDFGFPTRRPPQFLVAESTTVAICKTCKEPIPSNLGICDACKETIVLSSSPGDTAPPLTPSTETFTLAELAQAEKTSSSESNSPSSTSPKRRSRRSSAAQLIDPPVRLSSLRPPPSQSTPRSSTDVSRPRKASLPGPSELLRRLQMSRKPIPLPATFPTTPTTTPPSTSHSHSHSSVTRTRPCSLANVTTPPTTATAAYRSTRHSSATPSELSTMFPYIASSTTTSPPSLCRTSYQLQNTMSAWEDSDSEDEEKVGLVGYWRGRRWRGGRGSLGRHPSQARRDSAGREDEARKADTGKKRRGFVRVISCGCNED